MNTFTQNVNIKVGSRIHRCTTGSPHPRPPFTIKARGVEQRDLLLVLGLNEYEDLLTRISFHLQYVVVVVVVVVYQPASKSVT